MSSTATEYSLSFLDNMATSQWSNSCCNPFGESGHSSRRKNLRPVAKWMCERAPISTGSKICDNCRKKLAKVPVTVPSSESESYCKSGKDPYVDVPQSLASLNQLVESGETPVSKSKLHQSRYPRDKVEKITAAMKRVVLYDVKSDDSDDDSEVIKQLKAKFHSLTIRSEKYNF